jgi:hypothetical protein
MLGGLGRGGLRGHLLKPSCFDLRVGLGSYTRPHGLRMTGGENSELSIAPLGRK